MLAVSLNIAVFVNNHIVRNIGIARGTGIAGTLRYCELLGLGLGNARIVG